MSVLTSPFLSNTMCWNRENREEVRERQCECERKHNSRALLNKKSVTINSKLCSWPQHCFRFRRPGFSFSPMMVTALLNQIVNPPPCHFLSFFCLLGPDLSWAGYEPLYNDCLSVYTYASFSISIRVLMYIYIVNKRTAENAEDRQRPQQPQIT